MTAVGNPPPGASGRTSVSAATDQPGIFLRKASGVVKAFAPFDAYAYNVLANNAAFLGAIAFLTAMWAMPGGNMALAVILTVILTFFMVVVYSFLQASFPRSGGDYVFQSRILGGGVGFVFGFATWVITPIVWTGTLGWSIANIVVSPGLSMIGAYTNNPTLQSIATWSTGKWGLFVWGTICILWATIITSVGFKVYAKVQRYFFWIGGAAILGMLATLLFSSHDGFVSQFNSVMAAKFGVQDAVNSTIAAAKAAGHNPSQSFSLAATIAMIPVMWFFTSSSVYSSGQAGEIRDKGSVRSKIWQMGGALVTGGILMTLFAYLLVDRMGGSFLSSSTWLYYNSPDQYPLPVSPFYGFFVSATHASPLLVILIMVAFGTWQFMSLPNNQVYGSRVLLAMAIDRTAPAWVGKVNLTTHTPLNAVLLISGGGMVVNAFYSFTGWFWKLTLSLGLLMLLAYLASCVAVLIWPFIKPDDYAASPVAKYTIGRIPVAAICAVVFIIGGLYIVEQYITVPTLGVASSVGYSFVGGALAAGVILHFAFKAYRRRKESLDLNLVYKQIPPE
jgi:basic amino acid/polyamine antiporter, APA family